ncbi:MAG: hypothetical protein AAF127_11930 [Pseudomonadota bacterium]
MRVLTVRTEREKLGQVAELDQLKKFARSTNLVINRRLGQLSTWVESEGQTYYNFHHKRRLGLKFDGDSWNLQRISAENAVNPLFFEHLCVGALTADKVGMRYYGEYSIFLRPDAFEHRSTVFEENPFSFAKKFSVAAGEMPPHGFRAPWSARALLVEAKLGGKLVSGMTEEQIKALILAPERGDSDCDFIEVHIYGSLHVSAMARVVGPKPKQPTDKIIWDRLSAKLNELGTEVIEE